MNVLYHMPAPHTIYAGRTIAHGYKHAFLDLGHDFRFLTPDDDQESLLLKFKPDIFFTGVGPMTFKYLDLELLKRAKKNGTKVFVNTPFWHSPLSKSRINEVPSLSEIKDWVSLISSGAFGDVYYNICEQGDERMKGFEATTGYKHHTLLLAADKTLIFPEYDDQFRAAVSYVGTYLPDKKAFIEEYVLPLKKKYDLKLYGQDWSQLDRHLGFLQKVGQYLNIPGLRSLQKPKLQLEDERRIYSSSSVLINIHEEYQKKYGDINERTFKVLCSGGLLVSDNVPTLSKYFTVGKELVIAQSRDDWFEKIEYYVAHPSEGKKIGQAGRKKVLSKHTYHHRVEQILKLYQTL